MKLSNQEKRIYNYLLEHHKATAREIIQFTNYPSSKIRDLKKKGIKIETVPIPGRNFEEYVLAENQIILH